MQASHEKYILENINKKSVKEIAHDLSIKERKVRRFIQRNKNIPRETEDLDKGKIFPLAEPIIFLILILLGFAIYSNTFNSAFQLDDIGAIVDNYFIRNIKDMQAIWNAFNTRFVTGYTLALNYAIGKLDVTGYHIFNLTAHILTSIAVYLLIALTFYTPVMKKTPLAKHSRLIALTSAIIFLTHPLQTQAVTYIWQRAASLATFFYLTALVLYVKARLENSFFYYVSSLVVVVVAMFTKEITITLPLAIAMYEFFFLSRPGETTRKRLILLLPFLATLIIIPLTLTRASEITLELMRPHLEKIEKSRNPVSLNVTDVMRFLPEKSIPRNIYLFTQFNVIRTYLRLLLLPINQNLDYDYPAALSLTEAKTFASFVLVLMLIATGFALFKKQRLMAFGVLWFFLALSVESSIPQQDFIFEHRLYLPMLGFSLFMATTIYYISGKKKLTWMIAILAALAISYSILTYKRNLVWKDEITLWNDVISKSPFKARPYNLRGINYKKQNNLEMALADYNRTLELNPDYAEARSNRASIYAMRREFDKSIADFSRAIELKPYDVNAYVNRGLVYNLNGDIDKAITDYNRAIEIDPHHTQAYFKRANAYKDKGNLELAIADWTKAIELNPFFPEAYHNRAAAYFFKKEYDSSWQDLHRAQSLGYKANPQLLEILKRESGREK